MNKYKNVLFEIDENVGIITLNNPETLNALSVDLERELLDVLEICGVDKEVRAVILTGAGRGFSSGGDIKKMERGINGLEGKSWVELANRIVETIVSLPKPIIAAVNGAAAGGGMNLALICDMVVAAEKAFFMESFLQVGLIPDTGGHYILPRLVGTRKAIELIFTGERVTAEKALELGLINKVVPAERLMEEALSVAKKLAKGPTQAFGITKAIMRKASSSDLSDILELEAYGNSLAFVTQDHKEGVRAFKEKRSPVFKGE